MTRAARVAALGVVCTALLTACSPTAPASPTARPLPSPSTVPSAVPGGVTDADLRLIYTQLTPPATGGGTCVTGTSTPSWAACPLTPRLIAALNAALAAQTGPGADPLCGCQAFDPQQTARYSPGSPPGGATIHVISFGAAHVAYVVIPSGGRFLVDDIIYCTPIPHSVYPGEPVTSC